MKAPLDYLLVSPAFPYRGGIADSTHQLAKALSQQGNTVVIWTFTTLYPKWLFPGTTPFSNMEKPTDLDIERKIHAFNPVNWFGVIRQLKKNPPKRVVFRYYTPFLALCYGTITGSIQALSQCVLLVDNWTPHENRWLDRWLNSYLKKKFKTYTTLSEAVAEELRKEKLEKIGAGFHPIEEGLRPSMAQHKARTTLGWTKNHPIALFYGLIRPYKGLDLLIDAFALEPLKSSTLRLAIVGEFYESLADYQKRIAQRGLTERIYLLPEFADEIRTQQVFSAADIAVLPYRSATQSGVIPLAYHFEVPILVTSHPGLRVPVERDQTGWVCQSNPESICTTLTHCMTADMEIKKKNIRKVKNHYSWKRYAQWLHQFLKNER